MLRYTIILLLLFTAVVVRAQSPLEQLVTIDAKEIALEQVLYGLIDDAGVKLVFNNEIIPDKTITLHVRQKPLSSVLTMLFKDTDLIWRTSGQLVIIKRDPYANKKQSYTISGFITDQSSGEPLVGAAVFCQFLGMGTITNSYGFFSLKLPEGDWQIGVSYLGYSPLQSEVQLYGNQKFNWTLKPSLRLLEVVVLGKDSTLSPSVGIGKHQILLSELDLSPTLIGEKDVLRNVQLLPGVQTGADGFGGLSVRGGNPSQNLIIIDGVPVYSTAHAGGMLSVFNPEVLRSAKVIKGGFPARYGGRLSSVIELRTKEGNQEKWSGWLNSSLATVNAGIEGPLVKGKSSILLTGRASFVDAYLRPASVRLKKEKEDGGYSSYRFSDWNGKINYFLSNKNKLYLNFYLGDDVFTDKSIRSTNFSGKLAGRDTKDYIERFKIGRTLDWKNKIFGLRWNHLFSDRLFGNTSVSYSELDAGISFNYSDSILLAENLQPEKDYIQFYVGNFRSGIKEGSIRQDFDFVPKPNQFIRFGGEIKRRVFFSSLLGYDQSNTDSIPPTDFQEEKIKATSIALYWEKDRHINRWFVNYGLRATSHSVFGKWYFNMEPRISATYSWGKRLQLKAAYSRMTQFIHLLSPTNIGLATDIWVPSTNINRPQVSNQLIVGFDYKIGRGIHFSVEAYYKQLNYLLNFSEGSVLFNDWKKNVTAGEGSAKGLDFLLERTGRRFDFRVAYTYSFADRQFKHINLGRAFPFKYDRRHDIKTSFIYKISPKLTASAIWIYGTGIATTIPRSTYQIKLFEYAQYPGIDIINFGSKNSFRLPAYHRLDVGLDYKFKTRKLHHQISIGVYNLYNNLNPLYYDLRSRFINNGNETIQEFYFVQVALAPILPSLSYSLKF